MNIRFYFDPSCPWSWVASRWLQDVRQHRDVQVTWTPFSLAIKNDELGKEAKAGTWADKHQRTHKLLRVMSAASETYGEEAYDTLYTAFGEQWHNRANKSDDMIAAVLQALGYDKALASAADDTKWDKQLHANIKTATDISGADIGVPFIMFETDGGERLGYFGPVLSAVPDTETGLKMWDGLSALASVPTFFELKRGRNLGGPDIASTERVLAQK